MRYRSRYQNWLEAMYGLRVPASAQWHCDELGMWMRELEIRVGGSGGNAVEVGR